MVRQAHGQTTRRKSSVWEDFDYVHVPGASAMATCKRCGSTFQASSKKHGTSALRRHSKSSCCAKRAAERAAPCLQAAAPCLQAAAPAGGDDDDDEEALAKWIDDLFIDPGYDAGLFSGEEQQDGGLATTNSPFTGLTTTDLPFTDGDHDRCSPNYGDHTHMPQAQSSSSMRFFQKKRERSANLASQQGETTDKDHSSLVNTDWAPTVDNSMVYTDFTFEDAYD